MGFQNVGNVDMYCVGNYSCTVTSTIFVFIIKIIYVLFWTWILSLICNTGATYISWILVLFPIILFFVLIAAFMIWT
jgi:hypothetical protein